APNACDLSVASRRQQSVPPSQALSRTRVTESIADLANVWIFLSTFADFPANYSAYFHLNQRDTHR
ncbi:MAG: hypothetical protein QMB70_01705, partial [Aeromonadaceae bacterium]